LRLVSPQDQLTG